MTAFTDDDLNRLKHNHKRCLELEKRCIICDLLARLEVSERVCEASDGLSHGVDWNQGTHAIIHGYRKKLLKALEAWRTAAGR